MEPRVFSDACPKFSQYYMYYDGLDYQINDFVDDVAILAYNSYFFSQKSVNVHIGHLAMFLEMADIFFEEDADDE